MTKTTKISKLFRLMKGLKACESGVSMLEYALLVFFIGVVLIGVLESIGISISEILGTANEPIAEVGSGGN